jgi:hypothetical protein
LTLAVLLGHWAVLLGAPLVRVSHPDPKAEVNRPFTTRTITLAAPENLAAVPPRPQAKGAAPGRARKMPSPTAAPNAGYIIEPVTPEAQPAMDQSADERVETAALDPQPEAASPPTAAADKATPVLNYTFPGSTRLKYDIKGEVKGFPYFANGELLWLQDGKTYDTRLEISHFLLGSRVQTSRGELTPQGLEPVRFGDKVRSEVAAHFERSKHIVSFSANTPSATLEPGAQDQLSVFLQLSAMLGGNPKQFPIGTNIPFQAVGPRSSESWVFQVGSDSVLTLPGGQVKVIQLTRAPTAEYDTKVDIWLAPEMEYLPVRIRLSQGNGDFVEQQWRATQKP